MSDFLLLLVEAFRQYNLWLLGGVILLQNNGIPLGASMLLIASGAFAYGGDQSFWPLLLQAWGFSVAADSISYGLWRFLGQRWMDRLPRLQSYLLPRLERTSSWYQRSGGLLILFSRFPLSALGFAVNISAGLSAYHFRRFLLPTLAGEMLWSGANVGLGFWFGDSWDEIAVLIGRFSTLVLIWAALLLTVYLGWRWWKNGARRRLPINEAKS